MRAIAVVPLLASCCLLIGACSPQQPIETSSRAAELLERARTHARSAEDDVAVDLFARAESAARGERQVAVEIDAIIGQGDVLREAGAAERALGHYDRALLRFQETASDDHRRRARILRQRAQAHSRLGGVEAAGSDLSAAAAIFERLELRAELAGVVATHSVLASQTGRWQEAVDLGRRALQDLGPQVQSAVGLGALSAVAYGEHRLGQLDAAERHYSELIERAFDRGDQRLLLFASCNRAELRRQRGELQHSEEELRAVVASFEEMRARQPTTPPERALMFDEQANAFDQLIQLLVDSWRSEEAFAVSERFRAQSFLERIGAETQTRASGTREVDMGLLQESLDEDQALLSYWVLEDRTLVWSVTRAQHEMTQIPISRDRLTAELFDYLEEVRSVELARTAAWLEAEEEHLAVGQQLYRWLIEPLPEAVQGKRHWIILPDHGLHRLPLEVLPSECPPAPSEINEVLFARYEDCRFVGLERAISYVPSAAAHLALTQRTPARSSRSLVLAPRMEPGGVAGRPELPPLPRAAEEALAVAAALSSPKVLMADDATENSLMQAGELRALHLATHGWADESDPARSGIALSVAGGLDGILSADEVIEHRLRAQLVTLSTCASARGPLRRSEGFLGLARAFLSAGTETVIGSLWQVDDDLSWRLMPSFYRHWDEGGVRPSEAMRRARQEVFGTSVERENVFKSRTIALAHPLFWGPYVVVGSP